MLKTRLIQYKLIQTNIYQIILPIIIKTILLQGDLKMMYQEGDKDIPNKRWKNRSYSTWRNDCRDYYCKYCYLMVLNN